MPLVREIDEMRYQWDEPFVVDDRRVRKRFGLSPTDAYEAARATVDWARETYELTKAGVRGPGENASALTGTRLGPIFATGSVHPRCAARYREYFPRLKLMAPH